MPALRPSWELTQMGGLAVDTKAGLQAQHNVKRFFNGRRGGTMSSCLASATFRGVSWMVTAKRCSRLAMAGPRSSPKAVRAHSELHTCSQRITFTPAALQFGVQRGCHRQPPPPLRQRSTCLPEPPSPTAVPGWSLHALNEMQVLPLVKLAVCHQ